MATLTFKPKNISKKIMGNLNERAYDVVLNRFGLGGESERKTLESIGNMYSITRERVRQIENAALMAIKKSDAFEQEKAVFDELKELMVSLGSVVHEGDLLSHISKDKLSQNHINFFLVLGDEFTRHKDDDHFNARWSVDNDVDGHIHDGLKNLYKSLNNDDIIAEADMIDQFLDEIKSLNHEYKNQEIARRWLLLSKKISRNPLGEWGKATSSNIKTKGVKDYAFLVMRQHGSPMHFREVAKSITEVFKKKTNSATCHNELIKDARFVLVGRGTYGLSEWGYRHGVVKDVLRDILKEKGALSKDDIIELMMKERFLKRNTIMVNLQNPKYFKKTKDGLYKAV
ncbi:hypothetical protein COB64_01740 [Candidatus Wolfebacteria bacterium]|nr:MAG: hypothetical protein COB64_01740 [Candidatus Wolfebacteria bacterium]